MRANADAIAVGIGTLLADDPELTVRDAPAPRVPPRRVVFDRHLRTPVSSKVVQTARDIPTLILSEEIDLAGFVRRGAEPGVVEKTDVSHSGALRAAGVKIIAGPGPLERKLTSL